jgi:hypothetical protein
MKRRRRLDGVDLRRQRNGSQAGAARPRQPLQGGDARGIYAERRDLARKGR